MTAETNVRWGKMLEEIRNGAYARKWIAETDAGRPWFNDQRKRERMHPIEKVGAQLRSMMPFLDPVAVSPEEGATDSKPVEMAAVGAR